MDTGGPTDPAVGCRPQVTLAETHHARQGRACVVDLNDVTIIDQYGERILRTMMREGARCLARGVFTTYLLAAIAPQQPEEDA